MRLYEHIQKSFNHAVCTQKQNIDLINYYLSKHNLSKNWSLIIAPCQSIKKQELMKIGINPDKVIVIQKEYCEDVFFTAIQALNSKNYGCILTFDQQLTAAEKTELKNRASTSFTSLYILQEQRENLDVVRH